MVKLTGQQRCDRSRRGSGPARVWVALAVVAVLGGALWWVLGGMGAMATPASNEALKAGAAIYARHCASCHGRDLEGTEGRTGPLAEGVFPAPPHDASGHTWHHPDSQLFEITKSGGQAVAPAAFQSRMPAFGDTLSDAEIWAVLDFIKSSWTRTERDYQKEVTRRSR